MLKIKEGDMVRVIAGKDKGKEGKVTSVDAKHSRVIVDGVNKVSKHMKPTMANQSGGIIEQEAPIHISNVMYLDNGEPTRIGFTFQGENAKGKPIKHRVAKKSGRIID
ncbi:MAG: 50S ribosomal protein L24 [Clostridiales bacterium]|nr:50S ribosomal protein L24 [Clostridiales bacterium]